MINMYHNLPQVYFDESRDFQVIARTYEALYNYLKTNVDSMEDLSLGRNMDQQLLEMATLTVGFSTKHRYNPDDLAKICSSFAEIVKYKGSKMAILLAVRTILNAQHNNAVFNIGNIGENPMDRNDIIIMLPTSFSDTSLLEDIFDYILPAGTTYSFTFVAIAGVEASTDYIETELTVAEKMSRMQTGRVASYQENTERFSAEEQPEETSQVSSLSIVSGREEN